MVKKKPVDQRANRISIFTYCKFKDLELIVSMLGDGSELRQTNKEAVTSSQQYKHNRSWIRVRLFL